MSKRPFRLVITETARQTAELWSSVSALETQARREIADIFGDDFNLARCFSRERETFIRHWFQHGEDLFLLMPRDARTWEVCSPNGEPPCPPYPIFFSDRAMAMINALGWDIGAIEAMARRALKGAQEPDYGFCDFQVPIEELAFKGRLTDDDTVEVDLDDWWHEMHSTL